MDNGFAPRASYDANDDPDDDGLPNKTEFDLGTDPHSSDTDGDGLPDGWEVDNGLDPKVNDAKEDFDEDGLSNETEYALGTYAWSSDTDSDGLLDGEELECGSDPTNPDTDGDSMDDHFECLSDDLDPRFPGDGDLDFDSDGLTNLQEFRINASPNKPDTDGDGIPDGNEIENRTDPVNPNNEREVGWIEVKFSISDGAIGSSRGEAKYISMLVGSESGHSVTVRTPDTATPPDTFMFRYDEEYINYISPENTKPRGSFRSSCILSIYWCTYRNDDHRRRRRCYRLSYV